LVYSPVLARAGDSAESAAAMWAVVRADWEAQEKRLSRTPQSPEAIQAALKRASLLLEDLRRIENVPDLLAGKAELQRLTDRARSISTLDQAARLDLYDQVRTLTREMVLKNPLVTSRPILFMQRRRAVGYMLYEYLGWYYTYGSDPTSGAKNPQIPTAPTGGGVYLLEKPGRTMEVKDLTAGLLPPGHFVTLSLAFDAKTIYFAFADPAGKDPYTLPGYARATAAAGVEYNTFHIFAMASDGSDLRRLTDGLNDDFDPCPLPDGGIAFESTRRGSKLRCGGGSPELVYTLHRMDAVVSRDQRVASQPVERRAHRIYPMGLCGPKRRKVSRPLDLQPGRRQSEHPLRKLYDPALDLLPGQSNPELEPNRVRRRRPSCQCRRHAGRSRPVQNNIRPHQRRRPLRFARTANPRSVFRRS